MPNVPLANRESKELINPDGQVDWRDLHSERVLGAKAKSKTVLSNTPKDHSHTHFLDYSPLSILHDPSRPTPILRPFTSPKTIIDPIMSHLALSQVRFGF